MLRALVPRCTTLVCTAAPNPRALPPATLASLAEQLGPPRRSFPRHARRSRGRASWPARRAP